MWAAVGLPQAGRLTVHQTLNLAPTSFSLARGWIGNSDSIPDRTPGFSRRAGIFNSGLQFGFPSLAGVQVAGRYPGQPFLPGIVRLEAGDASDRARAASLRQLTIAFAAEDLRRDRPDIVAVDRQATIQGMPDGFDLLGYFTADADFRDAWSEYRLRDKVDGWDLYTRKDAHPR